MENFILNALPSIRESISLHNREAPQNPTIDETDSDDDDHSYDSADEGFSFGILAADSCNKTPNLKAGEMFHRGHILPLYSISKDDTDSDTSPIQAQVAGGSFDIPNASQESMKSWSTGWTRKRNPIHEFLFGARSRSDGKEKLGFYEKGSGSVEGKKKKKEKDKAKSKAKGKAAKDVNKMDYAKNGERGKDVLVRRRSFLPYLGIFGGGPMHDHFSKNIFF